MTCIPCTSVNLIMSQPHLGLPVCARGAVRCDAVRCVAATMQYNTMQFSPSVTVSVNMTAAMVSETKSGHVKWIYVRALEYLNSTAKFTQLRESVGENELNCGWITSLKIVEGFETQTHAIMVVLREADYEFVETQEEDIYIYSWTNYLKEATETYIGETQS